MRSHQTAHHFERSSNDIFLLQHEVLLKITQNDERLNARFEQDRVQSMFIDKFDPEKYQNPNRSQQKNMILVLTLYFFWNSVRIQFSFGLVSLRISITRNQFEYASSFWSSVNVSYASTLGIPNSQDEKDGRGISNCIHK